VDNDDGLDAYLYVPASRRRQKLGGDPAFLVTAARQLSPLLARSPLYAFLKPHENAVSTP